MAKDNLFLGFGRGKVGDVVFYRRDGQQIARARNRAPRNPNTFRQQLQRAVSANVQRLYSAGMQVFNHSFEGYKVGEGNQRVFVKRNMDKLRSLIVADYNLNRADTACLGRIGAPGLTIPVPFDGMIISNGSIQQTVFSFDNVDGFMAPEPLRDDQEAIRETVGNYALRVGLVPGDIYTFVAFGSDPLQGSELAYFGPMDSYIYYAAIFSQLFGFCQLRVKEGVTEDSTPISNSTTLGALFEAGTEGVDLTGRNLLLSIVPQSIDTRMASGCIGCIRSREDSGVRSPSEMHVMRNSYGWGLTVNYLENAWGARAGINGSDLLLEGSDFVDNTVAVQPYDTTTSGGTAVTLLGCRYKTVTVQKGSGSVSREVPVAYDAAGNDYYFRNDDTESKNYGMYIGSMTEVEGRPCIIQSPAPTNDNTLQVEPSNTEGDIWPWMMTCGFTWSIWVQLP